MSLKDALQPPEPHRAVIPLPDGLLWGIACSGEVVFRIPTGRELLDLNEQHPPATPGYAPAVLALLLIEVRDGDDVLPAAELDLDALPLPAWQFLTQAAVTVFTHGVSRAGEALRAWRAAQSQGERSEQSSPIS